MMKKSGQCRTTADRTTAASIIQGIGPQKYERNFRNSLVFFSSISLGPYWLSASAPRPALRPSGDDPSFRLQGVRHGHRLEGFVRIGLRAGLGAHGLGRGVVVCHDGCSFVLYDVPSFARSLYGQSPLVVEPQ